MLDRLSRLKVGQFTMAMSIGLLCQLSGCVSSKQLSYFQDLSSKPDSVLVRPYLPVIQPGDLLSIQVSSLNPEASSVFNPYASQSITMPNMVNPTNPLPVMPGYLVAADSTVTLPLVGKIAIGGQTNALAGERIRTRLKDYLKEPTVSVRNQNFRVTVLGEVARPSIFNIASERITLPEALGLAGDLTIYGRRQNVLIVREEGGQRNYVRLDLTKRDVFRSPYYYIHPNDVIYVEPGNSRVASADRFYQVVPIILSALSFLAIIIIRR